MHYAGWKKINTGLFIINNLPYTFLFSLLILTFCAKKEGNLPDFPLEVRQVEIESTVDGSKQPALFYIPEETINDSSKPVPLLVALHTWSFDYSQKKYRILYRMQKTRMGFDSSQFPGY